MAGRDYRIDLSVETSLKGLTRTDIRRTGERLLAGLGWKKAALSLVLLDDEAMQEANRRWLGHDRTTDVIAFSQLEGAGPRPEVDGLPFLGDVLICLPVAQRQAAGRANSLRYEFFTYLCHGILHLMGHDDGDPKGARRMARLQREILRTAGVGRT